MLTEGHLFLPFPALCYPKAYFTMWAILGRRSPDQRALTRGQTLASNIKIHGQSQCSAYSGVAEGSERMRRSRAPYRHKKLALERV